eukprot:scaffold84993_cov19-Tisochrysis_lutea.AAC.3
MRRVKDGARQHLLPCSFRATVLPGCPQASTCNAKHLDDEWHADARTHACATESAVNAPVLAVPVERGGCICDSCPWLSSCRPACSSCS